MPVCAPRRFAALLLLGCLVALAPCFDCAPPLHAATTTNANPQRHFFPFLVDGNAITPEDQQRIAVAAQTATALAGFVKEIVVDGSRTVESVLLGEVGALEAFDNSITILGNFSTEILDLVLEHVDGLSDRELGELYGVIIGTVAIEVGAAAATGGLLLVAKGATMTRVLARVRALLEAQGVPAGKLDELAGFFNLLENTPVTAAGAPNRAAEATLSLWSHARRQGAGRLEAYSEVQAKILAGQAKNASRADLVDLAKAVIDDIHRFPPETGPLPSVAQLRNTVLPNHRRDLAVDIHHLFQEKWFKRLYRQTHGVEPSAQLTNSMPGYPLWVREHRRGRGVEMATFHDRLDARLAELRPDGGLPTRGELLQAHSDVYDAMGLQHLWPATRQWVESKLDGVP